MLEKVKDFFYDMSDVMLSIVIIAIMFYTISWKLSDTMSYTPSFDLPFMTSKADVPTVPTTVPDDSSHIAINDTSPVVNNPSDIQEGEVIDMTPVETQTPEVVEASEPEVTQPVTPEAAKPKNETINVIQSKEISFVVPSGMLASSIIQKLLDEGLIQNKSDFSKRLTERKLDSKLRSGTFNLSTSMTYDQIINKLTGQ